MTASQSRGAAFRWRWLKTIAGAFLFLIGAGSAVGRIQHPDRAVYGAQGTTRLFLGLTLDTFFIAAGAYLLLSGIRALRASRSGSGGEQALGGLMARVDAMAERAGQRSRWPSYSTRKKRWGAAVLTIEAAAGGIAIGWLMAHSGSAEPAPWIAGAAFFLWLTAFVWEMTVDPKKASKWAILTAPLLVVVIMVAIIVGFALSPT